MIVKNPTGRPTPYHFEFINIAFGGKAPYRRGVFHQRANKGFVSHLSQCWIVALYFSYYRAVKLDDLISSVNDQKSFWAKLKKMTGVIFPMKSGNVILSPCLTKGLVQGR